MKQALVLGGGSKFGARLTMALTNRDYHVHVITSHADGWNWPQVTTRPVDWHTVNITDIRGLIQDLPNLDLIFFNHNACSMSQQVFEPGVLHDPRAWSQSYFVACQLPFYLIQSLKSRIGPHTRIGWMLSQLIARPQPPYLGLVDYMGNKFTNACMIRAFAQSYPAVFFGINPDQPINTEDDSQLANRIIDIAEWPAQRLNGGLWNTQGQAFLPID